MRLTAGTIALALAVALAAAAIVGTLSLAGGIEGIRAVQASLQQDLVGAVRRWREAPDAAALAALGLSCFLYGVFHAAGPGHGKAVLAAYAATTEVSLPRVLLLAAVSALTQATVAVLLVGTGFGVVGAGARWITAQADRVLEPASYAAIAGVGLWLVIGGLRAALPRPAAAAVAAVPPHHRHHHHHHHGDGDGDGHDACCGSHHHPPVEAARGGASLRSGVALALAAGLRPCTGSLLVLILCFGLGLWSLGVVASYAIGAGTAVTVAALAGMAHALRRPAAALGRSAALSAASLRTAGTALRLGGGAVILLLGATLLHAALTMPAHPLL